MNKINDGAVFVDLDDTLLRSAELYQPGCQFILGNLPTSDWVDLMKAFRKRSFEDIRRQALIFGALTYRHEEKIRVARPRPGAREFLKEMKKHVNNVYILTTGGTGHQSLVANETGLLSLVDGLFNLGSAVPQFRWPVLVDDLSPLMSGVMAKMERIGVIDPEDWMTRDARTEKHVSRFFCKVEPWREVNYGDNIFEGVVSTVLSKLGELVRGNYWLKNYSNWSEDDS